MFIYNSEKILYSFLSFYSKTEHFLSSGWRNRKAFGYLHITFIPLLTLSLPNSSELS